MSFAARGADERRMPNEVTGRPKMNRCADSLHAVSKARHGEILGPTVGTSWRTKRVQIGFYLAVIYALHALAWKHEWDPGPPYVRRRSTCNAVESFSNGYACVTQIFLSVVPRHSDTMLNPASPHPSRYLSSLTLQAVKGRDLLLSKCTAT